MPEGAADRWGAKASKHFCGKDCCLPALARERPELLDALRARLVAARDAKSETAHLRAAVPARRVARLQDEPNATGHQAAARSGMQARVATMQAEEAAAEAAAAAAAGAAMRADATDGTIPAPTAGPTGPHPTRHATPSQPPFYKETSFKTQM